jgi:hypothetical protein
MLAEAMALPTDRHRWARSWRLGRCTGDRPFKANLAHRSSGRESWLLAMSETSNAPLPVPRIRMLLVPAPLIGPKPVT